MENSPPLNSTDAAAYLKYSLPYLYKLTHSGKLPCYKPTSGKLFFKREDLDAFLYRNRRPADFELTNLPGEIQVSP